MYSASPISRTANTPPTTYTSAAVSETATPPSTFPAMNWKGRAEPRTTSAMRCDFSSMTALSNGIAPSMSIRNINIGMTRGATIASASVIRRASAMAPLSGSTDTRPIGSALSQSNMSDAAAGSTPDSARRSRRS